MPNIFSVRQSDPPEEQIKISDAGTDALIAALVLAGSQLAVSDHQKQLIVWLAEHDRRLGTGFLGFCIADMPWSPDTFPQDRAFMVRVVDAASEERGWETLGIQPDAMQLRPILGWFRKRFVRFQAEDIAPHARDDWFDDMEDDDPVRTGFPQCEKHHAFLSYLGCQVCHMQRGGIV